ncbi:molybdopterin-binding oxidoreductase [Pontibacterium sp. N1Y112]|uniref:Molybdopterin-binding oxidoreductase n=1 Tax=Pontibacterium sinense TaxID=2781979 RepID=A0A8J7KBX0_9GAMM|nr:molybdopterin-binding oxidoreductase [Pontibacterium sinense]MBE9399541.1 molybdopterin-binding oxidoreductase [Pontibacterium sinense]
MALSAHGNDKIILTVTHGEASEQYSLKQLDAFPQHVYETKTPWTSRHSFSGPLLKDVMYKSGLVSPRAITARALNDYIVDIDLILMEKYPVLLATRMDGNPMRIRNKGPIWILFPLDQFPELNTMEVHGQMVWQLEKLESP